MAAAAAPLLEASNAGAVDTGVVGDAPFTFAVASGLRAKAIAAVLRTASLQPADAQAALARGSVDAWATWEPYVAQEEVLSGDRRVATGEGLTPGLTFQLASDAAIAGKRALLQDFITRRTRARTWALTHVDACTGTLGQAVRRRRRDPDAVAVACEDNARADRSGDDRRRAGDDRFIRARRAHRDAPRREGDVRRELRAQALRTVSPTRSNAQGTMRPSMSFRGAEGEPGTGVLL